jgi:hypothetical protein
LDADRPFMRAHNACHRRQPQSAPQEFRREERVENFRFRSLVNTATAVTNFEEDVPSRRNISVFKFIEESPPPA